MHKLQIRKYYKKKQNIKFAKFVSCFLSVSCIHLPNLNTHQRVVERVINNRLYTISYHDQLLLAKGVTYITRECFKRFRFDCN